MRGIGEPDDDAITDAMIRYGGSFVATLGTLYRKGDPINQARLKAAFPDVWAEYAELVKLQAGRR
jgi:hypothetical protein